MTITFDAPTTAPNNIESLSLSDVPPGGAIFRDAWVSGPLDSALLAREITIGFGAGEQTFKWNNRRWTVKELAEFLCTWQRGPKDGDCILQGTIAEAGVEPKDHGPPAR